jgi:hypothetical protein
MTDTPDTAQADSDLVTARNRYLTAVERSLIAHENHSLGLVIGFTGLDEEKAVIDRREAGAEMGYAHRAYMRTRDARDNAHRKPTP